MAIHPSDLPSTFYRVAVKVLIMDELGRLLVGQNSDGVFEIPGGGWEHDETLEECVHREMAEELHAKVENISDVVAVLRGVSPHGWRVVRVAVRATLLDDELQADDDIVAFRYVNRNEFMKLTFDSTDAEFQTIPEKIWTD